MGNAVIVGAGPGIGASVARRFATEQYGIGLIARTPQTLETTSATLPAGTTIASAVADSTDEVALRDALDKSIAELGAVDVLVYNAARIRYDRPGQLSTRAHMDAWAVNVVGAITAAAHMGPRMADAGSGTIILTGGMPEPVPYAVSLSLGKAGIRALTSLLVREYGPYGVHVATVTVGGAVAPGTPYDPDDIAEHYWRLHRQPREEWQHEVSITAD